MADDHNASPGADRAFAYTLAMLRLSTAAFLLIWSLMKVLTPQLAQNVFRNFYFAEPDLGYLVATGLVQTAIILAFAIGLVKFWSYGAVLAMHTVSVLSTWERLIDPYSSPNALFWAAVPMVAAILLLFVMRRYDRWLTIDDWVARRKLTREPIS